MTRLSLPLAMLVWLMMGAPAAAQTQIGGGTCSSSTLNSSYAVSVTGRQVTAAGAFPSVLQAIGAANFDGLSKVTFTLTADSLQSLGMPLTWSGTYSVQANCAGTITITTGGSAAFNLVVYNTGANLLMTGNDATYYYSGTGNTQPGACSTSLLAGSYTFNGTGYSLNGPAVNGVTDGGGLVQFDGKGKVTVSATLSSGGSNSTALSASGSYSLSSNCLGSATLTDSKNNSYAMSLSISSGNATAVTDLEATLSQASKFIIAGNSHTVTTATCSAASVSGTYGLTLSGRAISSAGVFAGSFQGNGIATFDGQGKVTLAGTDNTNLAAGKAFSYSGAYTVPSTCVGTVILTTTSPASFSLMVWDSGKEINLIGADATYVYSGAGFNQRPVGCGNATLSGPYTYDASGFVLSGTAQTGTGDESGVFNFDGQGNMTAAYAITASSGAGAFTATGTYSVGSNCLGSATLMDSSGKTNALTLSIQNTYGQGVNLLESNSTFVRTGGAHAAFTNPTQSIGNVASYAVNSTPPGSVFVLFGENLAARATQATTVPLATTLGSTSVTVNGELAPLFYADGGQIDAQMPWDIPGGTLATVMVKNGTATSNAAAVYVPATGTPGISVYSNNRAVVVNQDGSVNSATAGAAVGDQVVAYFTGGGPVDASGKLVTGAGAPSGLSPVTGSATVTVGTASANIKYIGLTPGSIGLYQVNFIVPSLPKGTYPVVINIAGTNSNNPVMTISN